MTSQILPATADKHDIMLLWNHPNENINAHVYCGPGEKKGKEVGGHYEMGDTFL